MSLPTWIYIYIYIYTRFPNAVLATKKYVYFTSFPRKEAPKFQFWTPTRPLLTRPPAHSTAPPAAACLPMSPFARSHASPTPCRLIDGTAPRQAIHPPPAHSPAHNRPTTLLLGHGSRAPAAPFCPPANRLGNTRSVTWTQALTGGR